LNHRLRDELLQMEADDLAVRAELARDGSLFGGYHPRMAMVHDTNAKRLGEMVREFGWPTASLVGEDGSHAAWLVAQHAINHPQLMRECRSLLESASARGDVPRWQFEYLDDRIRVLEGRPQRYGTQKLEAPDDEPVMTAAELERFEAEREAWRRRVGWEEE
jgi:uncharacterized protein DUF6624